MTESSGRKVVVLDANALMMPFQFRINLDIEIARLLGNCELVVPSTVLAELQKVDQRKKTSVARAALKLAAKYRTVDAQGRGDTAVLQAAVSLDAILLTNDSHLRRRAREAGLHTICLRSRTHLEMI